MAQATTIQQMLLVKKTIDAEQAQQLQLIASVPIDAPDESAAPDANTGRFLNAKA